MIYITGDTHGLYDFTKLKELKTKYTSEKDVLIILGDAGIIWSKESLENHVRKYEQLNITIIYVDGNHENFNILEMFPIINKFGAKMHLISDNIYHVLRGEIMIINSLKFLCIGGANSIDKSYRTPNVSYWKQEEITDDNINNAINNLKKYKNKVDYILTHCCDSKTLYKYFGYHKDESTEKLNFIDKVVKYKYWYFGHYHIDNELDEKKRCFYHDILEISALNKGNKQKRYNSVIYTLEDYRNSNLVSIDPFLYSNFSYDTKITSEDLPEWYVKGRYYKRHGYLSAKGVSKIKYYPNMWINHYLRDDDLKISYKCGKEIKVDGYDIVDMIRAIEKYENKDLTYLKLKVNFKASFYNYYHKDDFDFEEQSYGFSEAVCDNEIEEIIWALINKVNDNIDHLPNAGKYVMDSYLSDKIFDKKTKYYLKPMTELYCILLDEIEKMKNISWRYDY